MKVLHLSETPLSAAPYRLMKVQQLGGLDARLISHRNYYSSSSPVCFESDILIQDDQGSGIKNNLPNRDEIFSLFREAEVLHFHNYYLGQFIFKVFPELKRELKGKKIVLQVHSPRNNIPNIESVIKDKTIHEKLVIAQYHVRQFPTFTVVPNVIPIHDVLHKPITRNNNPPTICFSPSNTNLKQWNNKGDLEVCSSVKRLSVPYDFLRVTHKPHKECLKIKQRADIAIEEIITGSYHMCALEALSMGQCLVAHIDDQCKEAIKQVCDGEVFPYVEATPKDLTSTLEYLLTTDISELKSKSRSFMKKYWNERRITNMFRRIYEK